MDTTAGYAKLYHPRGPLVTLPVPADPKEAFAHISNCLDVGWLVIAPGLEQGEQKEEVGFILRGECDGNGESTPFLLLYPANEGHSFSFLKVYLNTSADVAAFEFASKMKLSDFPEYAGNDKPERGKSAKLDSFIVRLKRPISVIIKSNPKYSENERAAHLAKNEIYKVPRRLFVRWADQPAATPTDGKPPETPAPVPVKPTVAPSTDRTTTPPKQDRARQIAADVQKAIEGMSQAMSRDNLDAWKLWAQKLPYLTPGQRESLEEAYRANTARLAAGKPARRTG